MASFSYVLVRRRVHTLEDIEDVRSKWLKENQAVGIIAGLVLATFIELRNSLTDVSLVLVDMSIMCALIATVNCILILFHGQQLKSTEFLVFLKLNHTPPVLFFLPHFYSIASFFLMLLAWWLSEFMNTMKWSLSSFALPFQIFRVVAVSVTIIVVFLSLMVRDRARLISLNLEDDGIFGLETMSLRQIRKSLQQLHETKYTRAELEHFIDSVKEEPRTMHQSD